MNFRKLTLINSLIAIVSAGTGSIDAFKNYPGIVEIIEANTKNYSDNFKEYFVDGPIYSGDGTAYGDATSGGNCLFPKEEYYADMMYAALNNKQYNLDMGCGLCAVVVSTSNPYKAVRIRVIDQCPECEHGSLDFSDIAFKALSNKTPDRIKITWALIPCDVDIPDWPALLKPDSPLKFQFKTGSTQFWGEVEVYNTRYPVAKVEFLNNGNYESLWRRAYNYWALNAGGFGPGPYTFRVTLADSTVIEAKDVEMVIPSSDEGDEYSTGTQTILHQGTTSSGGSSSTGGGDNKKTTTTKKTSATKTETATTEQCSKNILSQGYSCCEQGNCEVLYEDDDGQWGVENDEWCGIRTDCSGPISEAVETCPSVFGEMGYECCTNCDVYFTDETGDWGVENNDWCGIRNNCI